MARTRRSPSFFTDRRPPAALGLGLLLGLLGAGLAAPSGCALNRAGTDPSGDAPAVTCATAAECDDQNPCTADACTEGVCRSSSDNTLVPDDGNECTADTCLKGEKKNTPQPGLACGNGTLACNAQGQCAGCMSPEQCGAATACETWTCDATICVATQPPLGTEVMDPTPNDCKTMGCDGVGNIVEFPKDSDLPVDDGVECTVQQCDAGEPVNSPSPIDTVCTDMISYCNDQGACVPCTATIGCMPGQTCFEELGCVSCTDTMQNGDETGVDCGGSCLTCDGDPCTTGGDCASGSCAGDPLVCISCADGVLNGDESDVDCGGSCPLGCSTGQACEVMGDCTNSLCFDQVCCNMACGGPCRSCDLPGLTGTCTSIPQGSEDDDPLCDDVLVCNGAGACVADQGKDHYGESCSNNPECFNNTCDNGTCRLRNGDPCAIDDECESDDCQNNVCAP